MIDVTLYTASSNQSKLEDQNTLMHVHSTIYREKQSVHNDPFVSHRLRTARFPSLYQAIILLCLGRLQVYTA